MPDNPADNLRVTNSTNVSTSQQEIVIRDDKSNRAWSGTGASVGEAATEAVRKFVGDRRTAEYVGKGG